MTSADSNTFTLDRTGMPASEVSPTFLQGMVSRMGVSFHKYGKVKDAYPKKVDAIASLKVRLDKYVEDGNTEWLMDVANFAMIEFMHPAHPTAHFTPQDSDTSPGRQGHNGRRDRRRNEEQVWQAVGPKVNEWRACSRTADCEHVDGHLGRCEPKPKKGALQE